MSKIRKIRVIKSEKGPTNYTIFSIACLLLRIKLKRIWRTSKIIYLAEVLDFACVGPCVSREEGRAAEMSWLFNNRDGLLQRVRVTSCAEFFAGEISWNQRTCTDRTKNY